MKFMLITMLFGLSGETLCKMAAGMSGPKSWALTLSAAILWGCTAYFWTQIYRTRLITEVLALYNPLWMIIMASIGVMVFKEPLTWKLVAAYPLAGICVWLLA